MSQPVATEDRPAVRSERYQGEFEDDERHGHGTCVFADGGKYTGAWRTGTIEGKGRYEHANGDVFEGEFSNRRRVRGRLQLADGGDEYDGEFDGELPHGEGKRTYAATGAVYAGQWAGVMKDAVMVAPPPPSLHPTSLYCFWSKDFDTRRLRLSQA